jgi:hypothetical protein
MDRIFELETTILAPLWAGLVSAVSVNEQLAAIPVSPLEERPRAPPAEFPDICIFLQLSQKTSS